MAQRVVNELKTFVSNQESKVRILATFVFGLLGVVRVIGGPWLGGAWGALPRVSTGFFIHGFGFLD